MNLFKLREAVMKNTCRPTQEELAKLTIDKPLRTSRSWEEDSEMGMILFIGIATEMGADSGEIETAISVDAKEVDYKRGVYTKLLKRVRFTNKVVLIKNYMRLC